MAEYERDEIKEKVPCSALLESRGWKVDLRESTSRAIKYRRADGEIIIVNHHGRGWFDPTSQAKGDVFSLAQHLGAQGFPSALQVVAELVGFVPCDPVWQRKSRRGPSVVPSRRWAERSPPTPGSAAWVYLTEARGIPAAIVERAAAAGCLREGPRGSMWAAHMDPAGSVVGWEERGPDWRGFAAGGSKTLFHLGEAYARRLCVTEAAIDAMSLAAIEGCRVDSLYASTGGGWSPASDQYIRALAARPGSLVVAACDANDQGDVYAARLREIAAAVGAEFLRLWPEAEDWNAQISG
ncbi:MAG: DUF3991 domain-containing protein [Pseudomonadota bacterium]|nr:MAG: hypothetical protein B7Y95_20140 [Rhizobiales bacterium 32-66-11]OYY86650.1 MAG: hypothetical protein B7Y61_06180 [Rhizobiales bacterium 35-66-30]OZB04188.1 MAG: hypothetical protein B7X67_14920 [Rhizobiales bacterium 39-66-18]